MKSAIRPRKRAFILYLSPGILLYALVVVFPICLAAYYGFFNWKGGRKMTFIGLDNYAGILNDAGFWKAFGNNLYIIIVCLIGQIGLAFVFAVLLNSRYIRLKGLHRTMAYFPATLSAVVIGFIWSMIYDYNYGLLNALLRALGLEHLAQVWLNNLQWVMFFVCVPLIWQYVGYYLIMLLSGFSSIDPSVFEMAEIDGASGWQKATRITLPMLKGTLLVCVTLCISGNMKAFDHIFVMTGGGPGSATNVVAMYAYVTSFVKYKMGYGSAMSLAILVLSLTLILGIRKLADALGRDREVG